MRKSLFIMFVLFCGFTAVAEEKAEKKLSEKIIGKWELDIEAVKEFMKENGEEEEAIGFIVDMLASMEIEFDGSKSKSLSQFGEEEKSYTVESEEDNILKIKGEDEKVAEIKFLDDDTIEMGDEKITLSFKRKK